MLAKIFTFLLISITVNASDIVLEKSSTATLKGVVDHISIGRAIDELKAAAENTRPLKPIRLVLDTPGGSVDDGMYLVNYVRNHLHRQVDVVIIKAQSMGFRIAQMLNGQRYITEDGTMLDHQMRLSLPNMTILSDAVAIIKTAIIIELQINKACADRLGLPVDVYRTYIFDQFEVNGQEAVNWSAADKVVKVRCSKSFAKGTCPVGN